jgi:hypothetical protein
MTRKPGTITRRDFVRGVVGSAVGASFLGAKLPEEAKKAARSSKVTLVRNEKVMDEEKKIDIAILREMFNKAVSNVTGVEDPKEAWKTLVKPDDIVGLVPTPHLNPTHAEVEDCVKCAVVDAGVPAASIVLAQGSPQVVAPCTVLICMPALKAHWLTGAGTVLKNYIMFSGNPNRYHHEKNSRLGEIWNLPDVKGKTRIIIVDALYPLCDKGPQPDPRYMWPYKGLIAGTDPVAVETVCMKIIDSKRTELAGEPWPLSPPPLCVEAADTKYGLGTSKWEEIIIDKFGWEEGLLL